MTNILFISNDDRINGIVSYLQPLLKGAITCSSDFDSGLKDVFDKRPAIVFIQRKIKGVSGDMVAQHIKGLLRDSRPKIVLLHDDGENFTLSSSYDDTISFLLSEPEIYKIFCTYLRKVPEIQWMDDSSSEPTRQETKVDKTDTASGNETWKKPACAHPPLLKKKKPGSETAPAGNEHPTPHDASCAASPPSGGGACAAADEPPFDCIPVRRPVWRLPAMIAAGVALALVTGVMALSLSGAVRHRAVSIKAAKPVPASNEPGRAVRLPAVVVANPLDAAFASSHPGWQRYPGERMEFRVFREKGEIRVIQVIGREDAAMGKEFFDAFLHDLIHGNDFRIASTERKNGYLIEKGNASADAEIILYRQEKDGRIKGFVISFS